MPNKSANSDLDHWNKNVEYLLCGLTILIDNKILLNSNIWIADMAASVHDITAYKEGLTWQHQNHCGNWNSHWHNLWDWSQIVPERVPVIRDQSCNKLNKAAIEKVSYLPNGTFSLQTPRHSLSRAWFFA
jgi:hypothetical protein